MTSEEKRQQAIAMLQNEVKQLYRKCIDADQKLDALRQKGMAKFATLFGDNSPFDTDGRHFVDYLPELAGDLDQLPQREVTQWPHYLTLLLGKIQAMHQLLEQFRVSLKD